MTIHTSKILAAFILSTMTFSVYAQQGSGTIKLAMVSGDVMVSNGKTFVKAANNSEIKPNSKVLTRKDATVDLVYSNGCVKKVKANTSLTVGTQTECVANMFKNQKTHVAALGDGATESTVGENIGNNTVRYALYGVGGVLVAYAVYELTDGNKSNRRVISVAPV